MKTKLYFKMIFILLANFISKQAIAQSNSAYETIDANNISARLNVAGDHFWDFSSSAFEVPRGSGKNTIFASCLWIGGFEKGNLKVAAMTYRQNGSDFWAGPLDTADGSISPTTSKNWDKIYKVTRQEILDFLVYGTISDNIKNWPAYRGGSTTYTHNLAPFIDINHDGVYNPKDGDYPAIKGDMMLWWIFNDNAHVHSETGGQPLKVEIHASAYAYNCSDDPLKYNSLFFDYDVYNRNSESIDSTTMGIFTDFNLGRPDDNYVGSYKDGNSYYCYNATDTDAGPMGYGIHPPVQAVTFLSDKMDFSFSYVNNFTVNGNPEKAIHYYYYLCGLNKAGKSNGNKLMYPGVPFAHDSLNQPGRGQEPNYQRMLGSISPFSFKAGAKKHFSFAYTYYRNPYKGLTDNIKLAMDGMVSLSGYITNNLMGCNSAGIAESKLENFVTVFPNPAQEFVNLAWENVSPQKISIINETGQVVYENSIERATNSFNINIAKMSPGCYSIKLLMDKGIVVKKLIINK